MSSLLTLALPQSAQLPDAYFDVIRPPDPAPGVTTIYTVPGGVIQYIASARFKFTCSGAAGNRQVSIVYLDQDSNGFMTAPMNFGMTAGQSFVLSYNNQVGTSYGPVLDTAVITLPLIGLPSGFKYGTSILGLQAGDQVSQQAYYAYFVPVGESENPQTSLPVATTLIT